MGRRHGLVQHLFHRAWRGDEPSIREKSDFPDAAALARWGREAHVAVQAFLGVTDAATLEQDLRVPWAATDRPGDDWSWLEKLAGGSVADAGRSP